MSRNNAGIAVLAMVASSVACAQPRASEPQVPRPVQTQVVEPIPMASPVRYSASIEAFAQVALAFKASGYVDAVLQRNGADGRSRAAQPGDRVTRGTVLARVREHEYRDRENQSRARMAEATAAVVKARLDLDRARTLFRAESLTQPDLDAAQAAFESAEARAAAAQVDIDLANKALADCTLATPTSGVILERRIEVGALAAAGTVAFVLGDVSSVKARFGIPDAMIESVRLGDAIDLTVEAVTAATFAGRVTAVAPAADVQSRVFDVEVTIPNQDGRLRPGMIGTVAIGQTGSTAATTERPLAVPLNAVVRSGGAAGSFAVVVVQREHERSVARLRRVVLGDVIGNRIVVRNGVMAGERVVISGATFLVDGDTVRELNP